MSVYSLTPYNTGASIVNGLLDEELRLENVATTAPPATENTINTAKVNADNVTFMKSA
jgi:hypothetical protein